jgi:hypothetical protein
MHLADGLPYTAARLPHENCVARRYKALERASSAPLVDGLPHTEWNVPIPCLTHDWRLQFEDLETQGDSSTYLHRTQLPVKRYGSLTKPIDSIDSIDRTSAYLIPNVSRGMNAKTVPVTARIEQTIIKTQSKIRSRLLITS